jgi:diadenylate cyclase
MVPKSDLFDGICKAERKVSPQTLEEVLTLAVEISREGREGRKVGTIFVVGDSEAVLRHSKCLILDLLYGHPAERKRIDDLDVRETVKELAQLDGAFVVSDDGVVLSAARYLDTFLEGITIPLGLGSRHLAGASISRRTHAVAVVVSQSSVVRVFDDGELVSEIIPEFWLLKRYGHHLLGHTATTQTTGDQLTVVSRTD